MSISAVNCTPIKPQVSFGHSNNELVPVGKRPLPVVIDIDPAELATQDQDIIYLQDKEQATLEQDKEQFAKALAFSDKLDTQIVNSSDIKKPMAIAAAVGAAALTAFASGRMVAVVTDKLAGKIGLNLPDMLNRNLKKVSSGMQDKAARWVTTNPGKIAKAKTIAGKAIGKSEEIARQAYKKVACMGVGENTTSKAFKNLAGVTGVATILPRVFSKDQDGDGVKDILQKSQNVYTGTKKSCYETLNSVSKLAELAEVLA